MTQIAAIVLFAVAFVTRGDTDTSMPIVGRTYDFLIDASSGMTYGQHVVLDVKDGYVKVRRIVFKPAGDMESVYSISEFERYNKLIPMDTNPFEKAESPAKP